MKQKLRFAILGFGYFGKNYARLLSHHKEAELAAVANTQKESMAVFKSTDIDCIIIATPASTHFKLAKQTLEAGKHVLVEKPMVSKLSEAIELQSQVKKSKKLLMVGHQYLYHDYIRRLKKELDLGTIGALHYIAGEHFYPGPVRNDIGCFWETATHELSILEYLIGPLVISEVVGYRISIRSKKYEDAAFANIRLENDIIIAIAAAWNVPQKIRHMVLAGDKGSVVFDDTKQKRKLSFISNKVGVISIPRVKSQEPLLNELNHFIDCVRNNKIPLTDVGHGVRITKLLNIISSNVKFI